MEEFHRIVIQTNYPTLVKECDVNVLLPILVQKKVFSEEMITKYINEPDDLKKKRNLFMDVQLRGPSAFRNLVAALRETNQNSIANLLDPNSNAIPTQFKKCSHPFMLPINTETTNIQNIHNIANLCQDVDRINFNTEPLKVVVKGSTSLYDDPTKSVAPIYSTHSKKRGVVLIINLINYCNGVYPTRVGAEADGKNLKELFLQMGLIVEICEDLTGDEITEAILDFKSSPKLKAVDMVFVIIMGHGFYAGEGCLIPGTDNKIISTVWIEQQFDNVHCKILHNRPKIFIYQTCRGNVPDHGVTQRIETDSAARVVRTRTDMLIAHSTLPGNVSHRDIYLGSWYIQKFCEMMMNHCHNTHLEDIFKMVDVQLSHLQSLSRTMQTAVYSNQGFKICYMHPKIYAENGIIKDIFTDMPIFT